MSLVAQLALLAERIGTEIMALVRPDDPGLARAWANFGVTRGSVRLRALHRIAGVARTSQGSYRVEFATRLADADYAWFAQARNGGTVLMVGLAGASRQAKTAKHLDLACTSTAGIPVDPTEFSVVVYR